MSSTAENEITQVNSVTETPLSPFFHGKSQRISCNDVSSTKLSSVNLSKNGSVLFD